MCSAGVASTPDNGGFLVTSMLLAFAPLVERYLIALEEAAEVRAPAASLGRLAFDSLIHAPTPVQVEERGEDPQPVEFPDVWPAVQRAQKSFVREQAVRLCRRGLQTLVVDTQERRTAHRMLKSASRACVTSALADSAAACQRSRRQFAGRHRASGSWKRRGGLAPPLLVR